MPSISNVSYTGNLDIDGVLSGVKWTDPNLTFSFPTSISQYNYSNTGFQPMNDVQQGAIRDILKMISGYANLTFTEVTEGPTQQGTLRYAEEQNAGTAYAYYPSTSDTGGDVWFNTVDYNNPLKGTYAYATIIHETGHALGLDHGQDGSYALPYNHDTLEYSVMTYRSFVGANLNGYTVAQGSYPTTLMLDDIAALQYMYGANYDTNATNTTYSWDPNTGAMSINGTAQSASTTNTIFMTLWDGGGTDTYDFSAYTNNLKVDLQPGGWTTTSAAQLANLGSSWYPGQYARGNIANAYLYNGNTASLIENAIGGDGSDSLTGNQANNRLAGGLGADTLNGLSGNDTLVGGLGDDIINGGAGTDTCIIAADFAACAFSFNAGTSVLTISSAADGADQISLVESFQFNASVTKTLLELITLGGGDATGPRLSSMTPADDATKVAVNANIALNFNENVVAGTGTIKIYNAAGNTLVQSISANNASLVTIDGNVVTIDPNDLAVGVNYYVTIDSTAFTDLASNAFAGLSGATAFNFSTVAYNLTGTSANNVLTGTAFNDEIYGLGGNDTLTGAAGNDYLDGGTGSDTLSGGLGNDTYVVDRSTDKLSEGTDVGVDTVMSAVSWTLAANFENLTLTGSANINGTGNSVANVLVGNGGANTLTGNAGNDWLYGKGGIDTLYGGTGNDYFVFDTAPSTGIDRVRDFAAGQDKLVFSLSVFSALGVAGAVSSGAFLAGAAANDAGDRLIYNSATGALFYDPDGSGSAAQQQVATLSTGLTLSSSDFLIIA